MMQRGRQMQFLQEASKAVIIDQVKSLLFRPIVSAISYISSMTVELEELSLKIAPKVYT